jgi:hypothetical protein
MPIRSKGIQTSEIFKTSEVSLIHMDIYNRRKSPFLVFALIILVVLTSCMNNSINPLDDSSDSVESVLEDLAILATQTQQARDRKSTQASFTATPGRTESPEEPESSLTQVASSPTMTTSDEGITQPSPPVELKFKPGGTSSLIKSEIKAGEQQRYTVRAAVGQTLILSVSANNNTEVYLEVRGLDDGQTLLPLADQLSSTTVTLPSNQEYQITTYAPNTDTLYFLHVEIPAVIEVLPGEKISLDGYVEVIDVPNSSVETRVRYLVSGKEGRVLKIKLESTQIEDLNLGLVGQSDGQVYWRYHVIGREGELEMPLTQGYFIDVYATGGKSAGYTLTIEMK